MDSMSAQLGSIDAREEKSRVTTDAMRTVLDSSIFELRGRVVVEDKEDK